MLREIFYQQFADIKREEWPQALLLAAFFFLVIATYWVLKPLKRGVLINFFGTAPVHLLGMQLEGAEAEQVAKTLNLVVVPFVIAFFVFLARRVPRHHLVLSFAAVFSAGFAAYGSLIIDPSPVVVWSFYIFADMFNTVMVALFWAFTDDIMDADEATRTYGIIGLGGVLGGFFGATVVSETVMNVGRHTLLYSCAAPMLLVSGIAFAVHRRTVRQGREPAGRAALQDHRRNAALEGFRLVAGSRYLLAIAGLIALYEMVSNVIDFQLAATVEATIEASLEKDAFFALVGQIVGIVSIGVQFFLTSIVLKRAGIRAGLLFLPLAILVTSSGYFILPTLFFAAAMSVSDNALNYSINQSAREALYVPMSSEITFKAKAFIDMFVQRLAKVSAVVLNLAFTSEFTRGVRWLSAVTLGLLGIWLVLIRYASRGFRREVNDED